MYNSNYVFITSILRSTLIFSSRNTLQSEMEPVDMTLAEEEFEPELSELTAPVSPFPAIQRPATPSLAGERSATPSPLPSTSTSQTSAHRANTPTPPYIPGFKH